MASRDLARAVRRFADQQSTRISDVAGPTFALATVTDVTGSTVTIRWRGSILTAKTLASYTPAAGDRVLLLLLDNQPILIDRIP